MYIEPEKGLEKVVEEAIKEFAYDSMATLEESILIGNAMRRALQRILKYQQGLQQAT